MLKTIKNKNVKPYSDGNRDLSEKLEAQKKWQTFIYCLMLAASCLPARLFFIVLLSVGLPPASSFSQSQTWQWAQSAGGTSYDDGNSCTTDASGNVFVTGAFESPSITFGTTALTNAGSADIFVAKLDTCISSNFSQSLTLCTGQSITVGTNTYTASGTYTDIFTAANGCDSTVTTNLTIITQDTSVSVSGSTLTANSSSAVYQWIDCNGNILISGETNQSFTASATGSYAVIVTENGCSDTSSCYTVTVTGITETILENNLLVYLNPGNFFFWVSGLRSAVYSLEIYNVYGEKVYSGTLDMKQETWNCDLRPQPNGIYFLTLKSNSETAPKESIRTTKKNNHQQITRCFLSARGGPTFGGNS